MDELIRLNKYLSEMGICSRRTADAAIEAGKVLVDGQVAQMGQKVTGSETIVYEGKTIGNKRDDFVLIAFNKPKGIVCTASKKDKNNIVDFINYPVRIYPVGRLDKDSHGLILLTNQGELVNKIMRASNCHEKEYVVRVNKELTKDFLESMKKGVYLEELETTTRPCKIKRIDKFTFSIILTQGLNRQIRRMCQALDYRVTDLKRIRIMNINLENLKEGSFRDVNEAELKVLYEMTEDSRS
ncbi:MAG: pseudouridine synthase [Pseudobutyrivibrio sp.]|nr:pseudouridine synthase [Pseudobutyrivibrio sp.]